MDVPIAIGDVGCYHLRAFQIAANEEVSDRERRLQEALFAIKTELAASSPTASGIDAALRHFDAIESLVRRNLRSPLNGFSATHLKSFSSVPVSLLPLILGRGR